jgi:hypothetical protein
VRMRRVVQVVRDRALAGQVAGQRIAVRLHQLRRTAAHRAIHLPQPVPAVVVEGLHELGSGVLARCQVPRQVPAVMVLLDGARPVWPMPALSFQLAPRSTS